MKYYLLIITIVQDEDSDSGQKEEVVLSDNFESEASDIEVRNL